MKTYCSDCGSTINYEAQRPNFCPDCGKPMKGAPPRPPARARVVEYEEPTDIDPLDLIDLVEVSAPGRGDGVVLGQILGTGSTGWVDRPKVSKADLKKFEAAIKTTRKIDVDDKG